MRVAASGPVKDRTRPSILGSKRFHACPILDLGLSAQCPLWEFLLRQFRRFPSQVPAPRPVLRSAGAWVFRGMFIAAGAVSSSTSLHSPRPRRIPAIHQVSDDPATQTNTWSLNVQRCGWVRARFMPTTEPSSTRQSLRELSLQHQGRGTPWHSRTCSPGPTRRRPGP